MQIPKDVLFLLTLAEYINKILQLFGIHLDYVCGKLSKYSASDSGSVNGQGHYIIK